MKSILKSALCLILVAVMLLPVLSSCAAGLGWKYTREDMSSFEEFKGKIKAANEEKTAFLLTVTSEEGFNEIKASDFVLFCFSDIDFEEEKDDYVSYRVAKKHEVAYDEFTYTAEDKAFAVTFAGDINKSYAVLVSKNATKSGRYGIVCVPSGNLVDDQDAKFEEDCINTYSVWDGFNLSLQIDAQILSIIVGSFSASPVAVVSGAFGLASLVGGALFGSEVTNADIMARLDEIDSHIAELEKRIDKNQDALINEDILIEAGIDKVTLQLYDQNWDKFVSDYLEPMQDLERAYTLYLQKALKAVATDGIEVELRYNSEGKLVGVTDNEYYAPAKTAKVKITDFAKAKAFLSSHKNTVAEGFVDAMLEDLKAARSMATGNLPRMSDEQFAVDVYQMILESLERDYFAGDYGSDGYKNSVAVYNAFLNLAKHITRDATGTSIVDDYLGRMDYIYNFASEMREPSRHFLSNMRTILDKYALMATRACTFAELNMQEIGTAYTASAEYIKGTYTSVKAFPDNYSYITGCELQGEFANSEYQVWGTATNPELKLFNIVVRGYVPAGSTFGDGSDITNAPMANSTEILKISKRFEIMKTMGLAEGTLYDYLCKIGIMSAGAIDLSNGMKERGLVGDDIYRFATGYTERDLKSSDKNAFRVKAMMHNKGSDYFTMGKWYSYRNGHDGDHWSGKLLETKFVDALTGKVQDDTRVVVYARYSEGHWYWTTDERWCFLDRDNGASYFVLLKK